MFQSVDNRQLDGRGPDAGVPDRRGNDCRERAGACSSRVDRRPSCQDRRRLQRGTRVLAMAGGAVQGRRVPVRGHPHQRHLAPLRGTLFLSVSQIPRIVPKSATCALESFNTEFIESIVQRGTLLGVSVPWTITGWLGWAHSGGAQTWRHRSSS